MSRAVPDAGWLAGLRASANRPPLRPRVPLWAGGARIGSVEPDLFARAGVREGLFSRQVSGAQEGWHLQGELTSSLHEVAAALRAAGLAHVWRDEQLAVTDERGNCLGTVERAVVRPLGITTFAVHLAGLSPDGRHWVQQRSLTKANDPGLWDTLMGGMIPACDSLDRALERETWEEAGLAVGQLAELRRCGRVSVCRPTAEERAGYVVEHIEWYRCVVPEGVVPVNQDGEVDRFELMQADEVVRRLQRDEFTMEASLILAEVLL